MTTFFPSSTPTSATHSVSVAVNAAPATASSSPMAVDTSVNVIKTKASPPSPAAAKLEEEVRQLQSKLRTVEQALQDKGFPPKEPMAKRHDSGKPSSSKPHGNASTSCSFCNVDGHDVSECRSLLSAIRLGLVQKPSAEQFREARDKGKQKPNPQAAAPDAAAEIMPPPPRHPADSSRGRGRGRGGRGRGSAQ